jgi:hypothetical protein
MMRRLIAIFALLILASPGIQTPARAGALVALDRCNDRMVNDYATQVRDYDAHPARSNPTDLEKRFNDIDQLLADLNQEQGILDNVCSSDAQKSPMFTQIGATAAWGLALESDIATKLGLPCPAGAKAFSEALLAQAWLDLASIVNENSGTVPADVARTAPKIQTRAAALGLTLPAYPQTSGYWRDTIAAQTKTAVQACPTPSGSPAPSSSP